MIVSKKELINLVFFFKKIRINMVIPIFWGSKREDPEVFLREYKRACFGTKLIIITKCLNFSSGFLEGITSHWFEQQT
jgi:hypothetical protein